MKIDIQVDLDWMEEDGNIDEHVKEEIILGVKRAISKKCLADVEAKASKQIDKAIEDSISKVQQSIEEKATKFADDWLENEVTVTDKWGDAQDCLTIKDLIKRTFDSLLEQKVDNSGKFSNGYSGTMKMIDFLTGKRVEDVVETKLKSINKEIEAQIEKAVNDGIRANVSNKFAEMVVSTARHDQKVSQSLKIESDNKGK